MTTQAYGRSPDVAELMRMFQIDDFDDPLAPGSEEFSPPPYREILPPAPPVFATATAHHKPFNKQLNSHAAIAETLYKDTAASRYRRQELSGMERSSGWNGSTQVVKGPAKPLKHQILNRTFVPPAPTIVERKTAKQLVSRLSKATVSSRMKEAAAPVAATPSATTHMAQHAGVVEVDRKRLHLQQKHAVAHTIGSRSPEVRGGREGIQLLLFYRKEVEKRLRQDPLYALHQDSQLQY